jgi:oxygen-independent coproporphyrinogen-3 oxidase
MGHGLFLRGSSEKDLGTGDEESSSPPAWVWPRAAYVHVPFCAHHCGYCDFAVVAGKDHLIDPYLLALERELTTLGKPAAVRSIFLGGGTPTHLDPKRLTRLLKTIAEWLPLEAAGEFTVEANPDTLDTEMVAVLAEGGVNRVSIGVQSFHEHILLALERRHAPDQVYSAFDNVRERMANVSLDLIFAAPGETLDDWRNDLEMAAMLGPHHLSTYGLTFEKGTRLWKQRARGEVSAQSEEVEAAMYSLAIDRLAEAGFTQYEISSHAQAGFECRHNRVYWANEAYFGFGLGAARYIGGRRETNTRDLGSYLRRVMAGEPATMHSEELSPIDRARETMVLQLRRAEGINRAAFRIQTLFDLEDLAGPAIRHHVEIGCLIEDGEGVRLTRQGKMVADRVIEKLLRTPELRHRGTNKLPAT